MTEEFLKALRELDFDSLTAKEAVLLRSALTEAMGKADTWFASLADNFGRGAKILNGRPPEAKLPPTVANPPVKAPVAKRRGRPVPNLRVDLKGKKPAPTPLAVGGADEDGSAPRPATIFENSYVSKDGPQPGAQLPPDHPRNFARPSSVTPEVDMSDFHEVEEAMRKGQLGKVFQ